MAEMAKRAAPKVTQQTTIGRDVDLKRQVRRDREGRRVDEAYVERLIGVSRKPGRPSLAEGGPSPSTALRPDTRREGAVSLHPAELANVQSNDSFRAGHGCRLNVETRHIPGRFRGNAPCREACVCSGLGA